MSVLMHGDLLMLALRPQGDLVRPKHGDAHENRILCIGRSTVCISTA
jgi:hypothetical protein